MKHTNEAQGKVRSMHGGEFLMRISRYHILLLILITALARFRIPFDLDSVMIGWRPPENASIALNYYLNGFHLLYPQIFWGGNGPGYVEMEFPIVQYATALLYKILGVHEAVGVILPFLSAFGIVLMVYLFAKHVFDPAVGFLAGFFVAISPPLIGFTSAFEVDPSMLFFSLLGLYAFVRWVDDERWTHFFVAAISTAMAILIKPTALYIGILFSFLCVKKYGWAFLRKSRVWIFTVLALFPAVLWYYHAHLLYQEYHNTFGILSGGGLKLAVPRIFLMPSFYTRTLVRMIVYLMTPCVFVFFAYGLAAYRKGDRGVIAYVWFAAALFYLMVVAVGAYTGYQYLLPVIPPGAVLASVGFLSFLNKYGERFQFTKALEHRAAFIATGAFIFLLNVVAITSIYKYRVGDFSGNFWMMERKSGEAVKKIAAPGSLVIVADSNQDPVPPEESMTPPEMFYFSDHRGWYLAFAWLNQDVIERLKLKGARYFVVSGFYISDFRRDKQPMYDSLTTRYRTLMDNDDGLVLDLSQEKNLINGQGL
jgi:4-amino-4-deoxy-L-arabinose transferase-like glycosyltransferase